LQINLKKSSLLEDSEILKAANLLKAMLDLLDNGMWRPLPAGFDQVIQAIGVSFGLDHHGSIRVVPDKACKAQSMSRVSCPEPETHSLYPAGNCYFYSGFQLFPVTVPTGSFPMESG